MATILWQNDNPIGKRIRIVTEAGDPGTEREVVGVAKNAKYGSFGSEVGPFLFTPLLEGFRRAETLHVRTVSNPADLLATVSMVVRDIDPKVVPESNQTMREAMSFALLPTEIARTVLGVAGVTALLLAAGGLYGLICYTVEQRVKEIGIRIALGASREHVFQLIVGGTVRVTLIGIAIGVLIAAGAMRFLSSLLIGLSAIDPLTYIGVVALMGGVTLAAGYVAARGNLKIDPSKLLKYE